MLKCACGQALPAALLYLTRRVSVVGVMLLTLLCGSAASGQLISGTIENWSEDDTLWLGDDKVQVEMQWSLASSHTGYFYGWGWEWGSEVAHAVDVAEIGEIEDAGLFDFVIGAVGPLCDATCSSNEVGEFVIFRNVTTGHYLVLRIEDIDGPSLNGTWWFQADGSGDFSGDVIDPDALQVPADYPTIQSAIDSSSDGDTILVAPGTYNETLSLSHRSITIISSGGPAVTTIEGFFNGPTIDAWQTSEGMRISGFTITGGSHLSGLGWGGGISAQGSTLTVDNCIITGNEAEGGGGVSVTSGSDVTFDDVIFHDNAGTFGGGGLYVNNGTATLSDCSFIENDGDDGGGLNVNNNATVQLTDCVFDNNTSTTGGAALIISSTAAATFTGCTFINNSAAGGGGVGINNAEVDLDACWFMNNVGTTTFSTSGGAMQIQGSAVVNIDQTLFDSNQAEFGGGALFLAFTGTASITNSAFRDNTALNNGGGLHGIAGGGPTVSGTSFCGNSPNHTAGSWTNGGGNTFDNDCEPTEPGNNSPETPEPVDGSSPIVGSFAGATNDGSSSCDPDGVDVFFLYTVAEGPATLTLDTCGSTSDTSLAIFDASDIELACSSWCDGDPCAGPTACLTIEDLPAGDYLIRLSKPTALAAGGDSFVLNIQEDIEPAIPGDLNDDGAVNVSDLLILLAAWGDCGQGTCPADLTDDGVVDVSDLLALLANWG